MPILLGLALSCADVARGMALVRTRKKTRRGSETEQGAGNGATFTRCSSSVLSVCRWHARLRTCPSALLLLLRPWPSGPGLGLGSLSGRLVHGLWVCWEGIWDGVCGLGDLGWSGWGSGCLELLEECGVWSGRRSLGTPLPAASPVGGGVFRDWRWASYLARPRSSLGLVLGGKHSVACKCSTYTYRAWALTPSNPNPNHSLIPYRGGLLLHLLLL